MKILIASGIFKPELGGPATFAAELGKRLTAAGHEIKVVTYASPSTAAPEKFSFPVVRVTRRTNKLSNYFRYFWRVWRLVNARPDLVYCLDWFSAGVPAALVCRLRGVPYIVRVGGGYIWEKYLSSGQPPMTLKAFYEEGKYRNYPLMFKAIGWVLRGARTVIFNSNEQRILFEKYYSLAPRRTQTIYNVAPELQLEAAPSAVLNRRHEIVFAGRLIVIKNVDSLIRAFARLRDTSFTLRIIGEGPEEKSLRRLASELGVAERTHFTPPLPQPELYRQLRDTYLVVIPSWTDISPHQVYECLALGIPFLLTKENYLPLDTTDILKIDPASVDDITEKLNLLLDGAEYQKHITSLGMLSSHWTWENVLVGHARIFDEIK